MQDGLYVQFGAGLSAPDGWLNFDASPTLRFERSPLGFLYTRNTRRFPQGVRYGDIVRGLPVAPESVRGLYCSHVIEHLALEDCDRALANCARCLQRGGTFRMVLPDLRVCARAYLADPSPSASVDFVKAIGLGRERRPHSLAERLADWIGHSAHLWMWDERSLAERLREHGFVDIRPAAYGDAEDPRFADVEDIDRFEDAFAIQCRK